MIDFTNEFGSRVRQQLESEHVIWLTTVGQDNTPQPRPVWFLWDGTSLLIYSQPETHKLRHIARSSNVSVHLNTDSEGHEVAVLTGNAMVDPSAPPADGNAEYMAKYDEGIAILEMTPSQFAGDYSVAIRVAPRRLRGS